MHLYGASNCDKVLSNEGLGFRILSFTLNPKRSDKELPKRDLIK